MAEYRVTVNEALIPILEAMAKLRGLSSIEEVLSVLIAEQIEVKATENDPFVGFVEGPEDLSERDEEILHSRWKAP